MVSPFEALRGRRVLVTGSTGFKGSWLCTWLLNLGAEVSGFALPPEADAPLFDLLRLSSRVSQHAGDIRDFDALQRVFAQERPEIVIHLAAQALVRRGYAAPKLTYDTNVGGSVNLLEAVRASPSVRALVFITSDKCYANREWVWAYRENDELGGHDPYSSSKAAAELVFASYQSSFFERREGFHAASARAGNVIGGGDRAQDRIVPDCIAALEAKRPVRLRNPQSTRPWQHVLEPLSGYLLLACRLFEGDPVASGAWNFAPDVDSVRPVQDLAQRVVDGWAGGELVVEPEEGAPHEATLLMLSSEKAKTLLSWRPHWDFAAAVDQTVGWYRKVGAGGDPIAITETQIAEYISHA